MFFLNMFHLIVGTDVGNIRINRMAYTLFEMLHLHFENG